MFPPITGGLHCDPLRDPDSAATPASPASPGSTPALAMTSDPFSTGRSLWPSPRCRNRKGLPVPLFSDRPAHIGPPCGRGPSRPIQDLPAGRRRPSRPVPPVPARRPEPAVRAGRPAGYHRDHDRCGDHGDHADGGGSADGCAAASSGGAASGGHGAPTAVEGKRPVRRLSGAAGASPTRAGPGRRRSCGRSRRTGRSYPAHIHVAGLLRCLGAYYSAHICVI